VTYDADLVGFARVVVSLSSAVGTNVSVTGVSLIFETKEQAVAAGKALQFRDAKPSPMRESKKGKEEDTSQPLPR
jgi:hypothetical protein